MLRPGAVDVVVIVGRAAHELPAYRQNDECEQPTRQHQPATANSKTAKAIQESRHGTSDPRGEYDDTHLRACGSQCQVTVRPLDILRQRSVCVTIVHGEQAASANGRRTEPARPSQPSPWTCSPRTASRRPPSKKSRMPPRSHRERSSVTSPPKKRSSSARTPNGKRRSRIHRLPTRQRTRLRQAPRHVRRVRGRLCGKPRPRPAPRAAREANSKPARRRTRTRKRSGGAASPPRSSPPMPAPTEDEIHLVVAVTFAAVRITTQRWLDDGGHGDLPKLVLSALNKLGPGSTTTT